MDPKLRFSNRVENYVKYRPGYPAGLVDTLKEACGLNPATRIADIGSGTGLFALPFLAAGCRVIGVEPNLEMRQAGDRLLANFPNFTSREGSAEATGLPDGSVDLVTAGQAFHWFDRPLARREFQRILVPRFASPPPLASPQGEGGPGGWVVLAWNERRVDTTPFLRAYEALLLRYGTDYQQVNHRNVESDASAIPDFFGGPYSEARFDNLQRFDFAGVQGRLLSSSYTPDPSHPDYESMLLELRRIFDKYQSGGHVDFEYDTRMFWGQIKAT